jgi:hypothetical protein
VRRSLCSVPAQHSLIDFLRPEHTPQFNPARVVSRLSWLSRWPFGLSFSVPKTSSRCGFLLCHFFRRASRSSEKVALVCHKYQHSSEDQSPRFNIGVLVQNDDFAFLHRSCRYEEFIFKPTGRWLTFVRLFTLLRAASYPPTSSPEFKSPNHCALASRRVPYNDKTPLKADLHRAKPRISRYQLLSTAAYCGFCFLELPYCGFAHLTLRDARAPVLNSGESVIQP